MVSWIVAGVDISSTATVTRERTEFQAVKIGLREALFGHQDRIALAVPANAIAAADTPEASLETLNPPFVSIELSRVKLGASRCALPWRAGARHPPFSSRGSPPCFLDCLLCDLGH